jgi:hypothetical protein
MIVECDGATRLSDRECGAQGGEGDGEDGASHEARIALDQC